jgi:hypothetical protein
MTNEFITQFSRELTNQIDQEFELQGVSLGENDWDRINTILWNELYNAWKNPLPPSREDIFLHSSDFPF